MVYRGCWDAEKWQCPFLRHNFLGSVFIASNCPFPGIWVGLPFCSFCSLLPALCDVTLLRHLHTGGREICKGIWWGLAMLTQLLNQECSHVLGPPCLAIPVGLSGPLVSRCFTLTHSSSVCGAYLQMCFSWIICQCHLLGCQPRAVWGFMLDLNRDAKLGQVLQ